MKHTEQDQPIHVNTDRQNYCWNDDIARDVPEWHDDEVFVDWYIDLVSSVYDNIADAREHVDCEYREYLGCMCDGKEEA
jgi:hypothetical protein